MSATRKPKPPQAEADLDLITSAEAAKILGISVNTLNVWRYKARNLPFRRDGAPRSRVRYRRSDVLAYLQRKKFEWVYPTKEVA